MNAEISWSIDGDNPSEPILIHVEFEDQERCTLEELTALVVHALAADGHEVTLMEEEENDNDGNEEESSP